MKKQGKKKEIVKLVLDNPLTAEWPETTTESKEKLCRLLLQGMGANVQDARTTGLTIGLNETNKLIEDCIQTGSDLPRVVFVTLPTDSILVSHFPQLIANGNAFSQTQAHESRPECRLVAIPNEMEAAFASRLGLSRVRAIAVASTSPILPSIAPILETVSPPSWPSSSEATGFLATKIDRVVVTRPTRTAKNKKQNQNQNPKTQGKTSAKVKKP
ncbi:RNase P and RNase MRP subunit [Schizosaccharomyces japonicus yFS275]|uniref:RNase P and RNase MRP subunit n=1 Tax=Schizosaccharomyces japonicus (strain yFS275 / FY16936) TaxID=402676 RepID=B6K0J6_SCHJY|nr:RNase P and RNase MRP subunit [Schizosaccharomyces japonicus yFS275]EEB07467.1 RNase P and RNase MRP subunit [Schizosaccharomyces japonicus yFS275]